MSDKRLNALTQEITSLEENDLLYVQRGVDDSDAKIKGLSLLTQIAEQTTEQLASIYLNDRGSYNASGNAFPASGGSGPVGVILKGDTWNISVSGTLGSKAVTVGDTIRALSDAPGQTENNWSLLQVSLGFVPMSSDINGLDEITDLTGEEEILLSDPNTGNSKKKALVSKIINKSATKTQDYTILVTDMNIVANPNVAGGTGQYGELTMLLPAGEAGIIGKSFKVFHGENPGIVKILCSGLNKINSRGKQVTNLKLMHAGEYIEVVWNGTDFSAVGGSTTVSTWQARSLWDNRHCGNGVAYDGKSSGVDLTGQVFSEATSSNTALCIYDSGGTGTSGIFYFVDMTGTMLWTNDRVLTFSNGVTASVNESTSSKNADRNFYHGMGIDINNIIFHKPLYNTTAVFAAAFALNDGDNAGGNAQGADYMGGSDSNHVIYQTGANNAAYISASGAITTCGDGFIFQKADFNF